MHTQNEKITVEVLVHAPLSKVWAYWTDPAHIVRWNAASDDWHTTRSENDVRVGGAFSARMEAKDGSVGFDFAGTYTEVVPEKYLVYQLGDMREVEVVFTEQEGGVRVTETFDAEHENSPDMQKTGWQAILDRFKRYVEESEQKAG